MSPGHSVRQCLQYDLDLTRMEDEQLAVLAQECGSQPARDELIRRHTRLTEGVVRRFAARARLQEADRLDALQNAVLWILEAIRKYRTAESVRPQGCGFRTFLYRVLSSRLVDFFRHCRRLQNHFPLAGGGVSGLSRGPDGRHGEGDVALDGPDPVASAEEGEVQARLSKELGWLAEAERGLWDLLVAGTPLREAAAVLGISYDAAKRQRRKLIAHLRTCLGKE
jgi:RNA polymerase sigma factor (sigma-70 family)